MSSQEFEEASGLREYCLVNGYRCSGFAITNAIDRELREVRG